MIDATIVRAHACASGYMKEGNEAQALGRSKGGFTTKIHALVDALGNPIKFILTGGHRNDITQAAELLKEQHDTDKGYDSQALIDIEVTQLDEHSRQVKSYNLVKLLFSTPFPSAPHIDLEKHTPKAHSACQKNRIHSWRSPCYAREDAGS
ncbi:MAG: hypothetical protein LEGION0403_FIIPPAGN_02180 [Legionella sp.]